MPDLAAIRRARALLGAYLLRERFLGRQDDELVGAAKEILEAVLARQTKQDSNESTEATNG